MSSAASEPATDDVLGLLATMHLIREFEEAAGAALHAGQVRGSVHQYTGQEAVATGVCCHLGPGDYVSSHHRGHGHAIAKGVSPARMMRELFGRQGGTSGGKGGSMHIADFSLGMLGANGVVPDGVTIAVGAAQALKMQDKPGIVVAFFGDGAMNRGPLFEAFNWAKLFRLPVLFVCEDNGWSVTLRTRTVTGGPPAVERVAAFGIPVSRVDGNHVVAVRRVAQDLVAAVRSGAGPQFLHATTDRWHGHLAHDCQRYRDPQDIERVRQDDCIASAERWLAQRGVDAGRLAAVREQARRTIAGAVDEAAAAPWPDPASAYTDVQDIGSAAWR
ncbi:MULTISPECIES: thiamine pyrophosphate-dependent dehydrogenase E1 component subunit alpha [Ramlibacter]|nr:MULTISPECIES: thiamine pyrophosphate-dependent dehydrogenase E1 component subunit alpha [Ramlibacter]